MPRGQQRAALLSGGEPFRRRGRDQPRDARSLVDHRQQHGNLSYMPPIDDIWQRHIAKYTRDGKLEEQTDTGLAAEEA